MGLWSKGVERSVSGMKRLEHVRKITLDELNDLSGKMDDLERSTYPIVFIIENDNGSNTYEVGPYDIGEDIVIGSYSHQYMGHLKNDEVELIDFTNIDIVSHIPTSKQMFIHHCNIDENTKIYLDVEKSFTGKYREFDEDYKNLENKYGWKYGLYEPEKQLKNNLDIISKTCETLNEKPYGFDTLKEISDWLCKPESLWKN